MKLIFDLAAAFVAATLCGMGVGGGGLLVVWLTLVRGMEQHEAQALNLLFFLVAASASMAMHIRNRSLDLRVTLRLTLPALFGTAVGSMIAAELSPLLLRRIFGGLLILGGVRALRKGRSEE